MDTRKLDLNLLVTLDALLAEGNVTRAARRLGLSQPAVSTQLARLRDLLGDPLLVPARRGMVPTSRALELRQPLLDALDGHGVKIALVTNKLESLARSLLGELGLTDRFATIIGGDTLGPGRAKPQPDLLHLMIERLGGGPAAYVGDTTFDTGAARAAGLPCVAVSFGFNDVPPHELGADAVIDHFDELVPALARL